MQALRHELSKNHIICHYHSSIDTQIFFTRKGMVSLRSRCFAVSSRFLRISVHRVLRVPCICVTASSGVCVCVCVRVFSLTILSLSYRGGLREHWDCTNLKERYPSVIKLWRADVQRLALYLSRPVKTKVIVLSFQYAVRSFWSVFLLGQQQ